MKGLLEFVKRSTKKPASPIKPTAVGKRVLAGAPRSATPDKFFGKPEGWSEKHSRQRMENAADKIGTHAANKKAIGSFVSAQKPDSFQGPRSGGFRDHLPKAPGETRVGYGPGANKSTRSRMPGPRVTDEELHASASIRQLNERSKQEWDNQRAQMAPRSDSKLSPAQQAKQAKLRKELASYEQGLKSPNLDARNKKTLQRYIDKIKAQLK